MVSERSTAVTSAPSLLASMASVPCPTPATSTLSPGLRCLSMAVLHFGMRPRLYTLPVNSY